MKENLVYDKRVTLEVYKGEEAAAGDAAVEDGMILKLKNGDTVKDIQYIQSFVCQRLFTR